MVKSRSSTSIFRSFASTSIISDLSGYDTDSVITFRPPPPSSPSSKSKSKRPAPLHLVNSNKSRRPSQPSSLPVTPGTPPTTFPFDPFSHPTTLPEPTRSRPASLAQSTTTTGKTPEIIIASPSTSTIHYLFPSAPSSTGNHLRTDDRGANLGRRISQRRAHPADAFSASTRDDKYRLGRMSRLASEPVVGIRASKTFDAESMRTLRRQPSLADIGSRGRVGRVDKENIQPVTLAGIVEEKKNKSLGLKVNTTFDPKSTSPSLNKSDISTPILLSPKSTHPNRRRSLSLSSPRPAPSIPSESPAPSPNLQSPPSPQLPSPNFGRPLGIEVGDVISSSTSYTRMEAATPPFAFPGGVPMSRGTTKVGCGPIDAGKLVARLDAERRLHASGTRDRERERMSIIPEAPTPDGTQSVERRLSLTGRVRRSLSLKLSTETKSLRRRSQSVSAKGERQFNTCGSPFDTTIPMPILYSAYPPSYNLGIGLGDPSVDMGDRYGLAKIIPSPYSHSALGLDVRIDEIGQRSPLRRRIELGGSDISLLASSTSMSTGQGSKGRRMGYPGGLGGGGSSASSPYGSPMSLPESLMDEAVDLTERGRIIGRSVPESELGPGNDSRTGLGLGSTSSLGTRYDSRSGSYSTIEGYSERDHTARPTPALSNPSTPYLHSSSQMTSPNFPSPIPQTPNFDLGLAHRGSEASGGEILGSPAIIHSPFHPTSSSSPSLSLTPGILPPTPASNEGEGGDYTTRYTVSSRKPNLRYSKSFTSDIGLGGKVSRSFSWRTKQPIQPPMNRHTSEPTSAEIKEKRLSRSFSFATRVRSPVPLEMRQIQISPSPILGISPNTGSTTRTGLTQADISAPRWKPPTIYSLCSPDGAVDPLPTPPRKRNALTLAPSTAPPSAPIPEISIIPTGPLSAIPTAPRQDQVSYGDSYRLASSVNSGTTTPLANLRSPSPFLAASSSFRGSIRSLSKSLSRTFERAHHTTVSDSVRLADSALKARISSPLEATRELEQQRVEARERSLAHVELKTGLAGPSTISEQGYETGRVVGKVAARAGIERAGSKEWRESILTQVVSASIERGLCEMDRRGSEPNTSTSADRSTSWSRSIGRTFGMRSSASGTTVTSVMSPDSLGGSFPRRLSPKSAEAPSRPLKDIGKEESNMSMYSTTSCLPAQGSRINQPPPIHISHFTPPKSQSPQPPTQAPPPIINFSHPRPPLITSPTLDTLSSSPPFMNLSHFPDVPSSTIHPIYRPSTPPSPSARFTSSPTLLSDGGDQDGEYLPQPLLSRLSTMPGNQARVQGKDERVKKVLRWRREIGAESGEARSGEEVVGNVEGVDVDAEGESVQEDAEEQAVLDGLIARHVEDEKEVLRGIVRRKSIEGFGAGMGY